MKTMLFNPYTGTLRHPSDIQSDPQGLLIVEPGALLLASEQPALNANCWCSTCRPPIWDDVRMVLCPTCGNKRCPHATDHRNACTGSNEPGQPGSSYPALALPQPAEPVPLLSDEEVKALIRQRFLTGENYRRERDWLFRSGGTPENVWGMDLVWLVRETEQIVRVKLVESHQIKTLESGGVEAAQSAEPVARLMHRKKQTPLSNNTVARTFEECPINAYPSEWSEGELLYTAAPSQRKPLTDEQVKAMWARHAGIVGGVLSFAREVESAARSAA